MASTFNSFWNTASSYNLVKCDTSGSGTCAGHFSLSGSNDSTILGGPLSSTGSHYIGAPCSSIIMGQGNAINPFSASNPGGFNTIMNGANNTASGLYNSIYGGQGNCIYTSCHNSVISGLGNCICPPGPPRTGTPYDFNIIGGGASNTVSGYAAAIFGGSGNFANDDHSFVGAGINNCALGAGATVPGGEGNTAYCDFSVVGGGIFNCACGKSSTISGGCSNLINSGSSYGFLGGGTGNLIDSQSGYGFLGGGQKNQVQAIHSSILGGCANVLGDPSANFSPVCLSVVSGGGSNEIKAMMPGFAPPCANVVAGGVKNIICSANYNTVSGGYGHTILGYPGGGGISGSHNTISGGYKNYTNGNYNQIGGGFENMINSGTPGSLLGSVIGGGGTNYITGFDTGRFDGIFSGCCNYLCSNDFSVIAGGLCNLMANGASPQGQNMLGGGFQNCIIGFSSNTVLGGGSQNTVSGSNYTFLGSGCNNIIGNIAPLSCPSSFGVIAGGGQNCLNTNSSYGTFFGVIGGGQGNIISATASAYTCNAAILGGMGNTASGSYSAILGGSGNSDGSHSYTGMYGKGLVATAGTAATGAPSNFWVDELIVPNIPVDATGTGIFASLPQGALYTNVPLGSGFLASQVFVK